MSQATSKVILFENGEYKSEFSVRGSAAEMWSAVNEAVNPDKLTHVYAKWFDYDKPSLYEWVPMRLVVVNTEKNRPPDSVIAWLNLLGYPHDY